MELAEKRYEQWLAQQGLEPELRTELDAMQSDAEKITDAFYRDLELVRQACAACSAWARTG